METKSKLIFDKLMKDASKGQSDVSERLKNFSDLYRKDGWNEEAFEELGLTRVFEDVSKLKYEVENARRGSYALVSDEKDELLNYLTEISEGIDAAINEIDRLKEA